MQNFYRLLKSHHAGNVFNPWTDRSAPDDRGANGPQARCRRLEAHLSIQPARVLIGEASGYQGCRISGIPFTSERLILEGAIPRVAGPGARLSRRHIPWSEPSATVVWSTLHALGIADSTVLWNAFPWHPYLAGKPHSNRTPNRQECVQGLPVLRALLEAFPYARVFAVGRHAERALRELGCEACTLRHPSMGGATRFYQGLRTALVAESRGARGSRRGQRPVPSRPARP
ncbi:MAG TPA: uracil-DNA glycosylase [Steroidobacteraceae bacterium]